MPIQIFFYNLVFLSALGCGVVKSEYKDYGGNKDTTDCQGAITAYSANIAPTVPSSCGASCHFQGGSGAGKLLFKEGNDNENRQNFKSAKGGTASGIFNYINGSDHPGSAGDLTEEKIQTWLTAEENC